MRGRLIAAIAAMILMTAAPACADQAASATARFVSVHGQKIHVEIEGSGPPLVFLHGGLLFFDNSFAAQRAYFASSRTVIGIDRVGHGHSPDDGKPFSYQQMADDTAAVIEQLGLGPVDVIGWSDGGNVGLLLAHDHPDLVRRLVITGANLTPGLPADELERRVHWSDAQVAEKLKVFETRLPPRFKAEYQAVAPDGPAHWQVLLMKSYRLWLTPVVIAPAALKTITAPVLVVAGDHDFTSIEETAEIFRGLPHGQLLIVPGTGHGTFEDRPAFMNLAVREFLDAPPSP
jgi:pimeloyl-ACP methyl ester carboxylesterase